jgi:hypothetical protein
LDYGNKQDRDYYKQASEKLEGESYNGKNLSLFLKKLEGKAQQFNWLTLLNYPQGNPPVNKSLLTNYGELTRAEVTRKAATYLGTNNREEQDSDMLFNCLRKSITDKVYALVTTEPERYVFEVNHEILVDGPCFLAAIIDHTYTNTKANTEAARENLSSLAEYMESLADSNVDKFNSYVKEQLETLAAGGETTNDLITNLFKGYSKVKDKTFREWIRQKKLAYKDGTYRIDPNAKDFMNLAKKHYQDALLAKEWMLLDEDQQTILALQTEIKDFKSGGRSSRHREGKRSHEKSTDWSWKKIFPGEGEPKTKKFKGRIYYWCTNHKLWCLHKPSECKLKAESQAPSKKKPGSGKPKNKQDKYNLKMRAYQTLFESSSEEEIEEEQESSDGNETEGSNTSE